jgi:hypothetical protein
MFLKVVWTILVFFESCPTAEFESRICSSIFVHIESCEKILSQKDYGAKGHKALRGVEARSSFFRVW